MSFKVNPFGNIETIQYRGTFMGNRGRLKVESGLLAGRSRWNTQSWIYCDIDPKYAPKEEVDPRKYTKLFFLDEPTALSAGHRPCWDCLRDRYYKFIEAWLAGNPEYDFQKDIPKQIDRVIHKERTSRMRGECSYFESLANLPDGVMVTLDNNVTECYLLQGTELFKWSPSGYADTISVDSKILVEVLTPKSIVNAINAGFCPVTKVR